MTRSFSRALLASAAIAIAIAVSGCDPDSIAPTGRAAAPLSDKMLAELQQKNMDKGSPILVRIFKEEAEMEVWKQDRSGQFALLKTYPVCRWSGDLGPKIKEGDRQAPEGFYTITPGLMNPNSNYYLAFNTGYPNTYDRSLNRTGSELMVHGDCSSRGCYAMTDEQMVEIYALARESFFGGQKAFQFEAFPFRMTALNMAKHRNNPNYAFWKMLKVGYDHFEVTKQEPKVDVCERRYVFDAVAPENASRALNFSPKGKCPVYRIDPTIADAVLDKRRHDEAKVAEYIKEGVATVPSHHDIDGGMNPVFAAKLAYHDESDNDGRILQVPGNTVAPGHLPRVPNPPGSTRIIVPKTPPAAAPRPEAETQVALATVPVPRPAPEAKEGEAPPEQKPATIANLFGNVFGNSSTDTKPSNTTIEQAKAEGVVTYPVAEPVALRGTASEAKPEEKPKPLPRVRMAEGVATSPVNLPREEKPKPIPVSAPPAEPVQTWPVDVAPAKPRVLASAPAREEPVQTWPVEPAPAQTRAVASAPREIVPQAERPEKKVAHATPAEARKPEPKPVVKQVAKQEKKPAAKPARQPEIRTAYSAPLASSSLMTGAQPTVAAGSFTR